MRVGLGYDSHVFEQGKSLVLGGVEIPFEYGLKAHSDGDVLIHAIIDALYGAAALGDIGSHFPDTDEKWRGADSRRLLEFAAKDLASAGFRIVNIDSTIICERPKLAPHIAKIRASLAKLLGKEERDISIKAKTNEKMDAVGEGRGIAVHSVALIESYKE